MTLLLRGGMGFLIEFMSKNIATVAGGTGVSLV